MIFLAFVAVALFMNAFLSYAVYKALTRVTSQVTKNVSQFTMSSDAKAWIATLQSMSERTLAVTEVTKRQVGEFGPVIERAQEGYRETLAKIDSTLETIADDVTVSAQKARDFMAGPASSAFAFAAGIAEFLQHFQTEE